MTTDKLPSNLPQGWCWVTTQELFSFVTSGSRGWAKHYADNGSLFLRVGNLEHTAIALDLRDTQHVSAPAGLEAERTRVRPNDLLISVTADIGMVAVVPEGLGEAYINQHIALARPVENVCVMYLAWYLTCEHGGQCQFRLLQRGATKQGLGLDDIRAVKVRLPPLNEQRRIVSKIEELFSDLDAGVAALSRIRANLKRYRTAVLKAAVEGRLTEEWRAKHPKAEPATKLLERILAERRQKWEEEQLARFAAAEKTPPKGWREKYAEPAAPDTSQLPELPQGWCWARVEQVGDVQLGRQRSPKHHKGPHMRPYLRVANVFEDRIDIDDVMEMNFTPDEYETYRLSHGDILLNEGQSMELVGRPAMYRDEVPGACFTNTLVRFRAKQGIDPRYALKVFLAYLKNGRFQKVATITVNIAHLGAGRFAEIEFPVTPIEEQAAIIEEVDRHFSVIEVAEQAINMNLLRAARLRQSILKRAFDGKLVPQDPTDEPASVLLERIRIMRATTNGATGRERGR
jgi:type I restriction enzyme S subunit